MNDTKLTLFLDTIGRVILGTVKADEDFKGETVEITNPVIVNIVSQNNSMAVQLIPVLLRELQADKTEATKWQYRTENITVSNVSTIDNRLSAQYSQIFNTNNLFVPPSAAAQDSKPKKVINLFDEEGD